MAFEEDDEARAILARHGYTKPARAIHFNHRDVPEAPTPPPLPDGFRYRTVEPEDLAERVAIHRDVWAPSRVTESSYRNVMAEWPYRGSLDCVVEAQDNSRLVCEALQSQQPLNLGHCPRDPGDRSAGASPFSGSLLVVVGKPGVSFVIAVSGAAWFVSCGCGA